MKSNAPEKLKELIPPYLQGRLSDAEKQEFEDALKKYPDLNCELMEFKEIKEIYKELDKEIPSIDTAIVFERIKKNIKKPKSIIEKESFIEKLKKLFRSYRLAWGIVAVQLMIILLLVKIIPQEYKYKTLSSGIPQHTSVIKMNIVFKEDAKEKDIREILKKQM